MSMSGGSITRAATPAQLERGLRKVKGMKRGMKKGMKGFQNSSKLNNLAEPKGRKKLAKTTAKPRGY